MLSFYIFILFSIISIQTNSFSTKRFYGKSSFLLIFFFLLSVNVILPVNYIIVIPDKHNPAVYYVNINLYQVTN